MNINDLRVWLCDKGVPSKFLMNETKKYLLEMKECIDNDINEIPIRKGERFLCLRSWNDPEVNR